MQRSALQSVFVVATSTLDSRWVVTKVFSIACAKKGNGVT